MKTPNLIGRRFDRLLVIERAPNIRSDAYWLCQCDCGMEKAVRGRHLLNELIRSCGCHRRDVHTKHGKHNTVEYYAWQNMLARCRNPDHIDYHNYGGRGISVCERWHTFENFLDDMGERPSPELSIERVDNNGNYDKSNCIWATIDQQSINKRIRTNNTSGVKGVCWNKNRQKWEVSINFQKIRTHIGLFNTLEEAAIAREQAEIKHWGK